MDDPHHIVFMSYADLAAGVCSTSQKPANEESENTQGAYLLYTNGHYM